MELLKPKEFSVVDLDGVTRRYLIGKIPYAAGGRRLAVDGIAQIKKLEYIQDNDLAALMFSHISALTEDGTEIRLTTNALIDNHVPDIPTGLRLEMELIEHNTGFSVAGKLREFQQQWERILLQVRTITSTLSQLSSSLTESLPSTTSKPDTVSKMHS